MKLPDWAKWTWWILLVVGLAAFLAFRLPDLQAGRPTMFDGIVFAVLAGLLLLPFFSEISMLGVTLKQKVDEVKAEVAGLRTEIRVSNISSATINNYLTPPPDNELPRIAERLEAGVRAIEGRADIHEGSDTAAAHGTVSTSPRRPSPRYGVQVDSATHGHTSTEPGPVAVSVDSAAHGHKATGPESRIEFVANLRTALEFRVRRLALSTVILSNKAQQRPNMMIEALVGTGTISADFGNALLELYSVCSPAVHGIEPTEAQYDFAKKNGPPTLEALDRLWANLAPNGPARG